MPVIGFVDLDRRFRDRTDAELEHSELEDAETFASLDGLGLGSSIGWTALPAEKKFEAWKADGNAPGWFFLDAVGELKLTSGKLDRGRSTAISTALG